MEMFQVVDEIPPLSAQEEEIGMYRARMRVLCMLATLAIPTGYCAGSDPRIDRELLINDVRQLAELMETVHPDPYMNGGGKIAFHRRLQETLATIPEGGMTVAGFYRHLGPFVAAIGDAHTWLRDPYQTDHRRPGGIPLRFGIVEDTLYVAATQKQDSALLGQRLVAVEGVPFEELMARQGRAIGAENEYLLLRHLAGWVLWERPFLEHLIPEWKDKDRIRVLLRDASGSAEQHVMQIPKRLRRPLPHRPSSQIRLPARDKCDFVYEFMNEDRKTALLVIDDMTGYREVFEWDRSVGSAFDADRARDIYKRYTGTWLAPRDEDKLIEGIPSATETFQKLVDEMKAAGTKQLLIDLRHNDGGASSMSEFLIYMLHGKRKLLSLKQGRREVRRFSRRYFENNSNISLAGINQGKPFRLKANDYDLGPAYYRQFGKAPPAQTGVEAEFEALVARLPSFERAYRTGEYEARYCPEHVVVICSPDTFSSGWTLMYYLKEAGALVVGTPSSQGPNCFGDILSFTLKHSGLSGIVSQKRFEYYPDDPKATVLKPDYPLSYEKLAEYDFDPNAEIRYALEVLDKLGS
ncbi:MAG: hypothetical protein JSU86_15085 [Phycisphaerales bacterium]|nr:MAG: hypothetical protein JSU86_15085 [Phycisphaerales bacterium]